MGQHIKTLSVVTVATPGTRVQLSATPVLDSASIIIQADTANTGNVYVGDVTVTSLNGILLPPGAAISLDGDEVGGNYLQIDADKVYIDAATSGNKVRVAAITQS